MARAVDQHRALEVRHDVLQLVERTLPHRAGDYRVVRAGNEQRGLRDHGVLPRRGERPVAVNVAIPVEPAAKSGAGVFGGEHVDVGFGQPRRQWHWIAPLSEEALLAIDVEAHPLGARRLAEPDVKQAPQRERRIAGEFLLGGLLVEIEPVVIALAGFAQHVERRRGAAPAMRHAHRRDDRKEIWAQQRRVPGDRRAPVMADDGGALFSERGHERDHVADVVEDRVGGDIVRRGGAPEAAHVGRDCTETRAG